jgi:hypothetical protein
MDTPTRAVRRTFAALLLAVACLTTVACSSSDTKSSAKEAVVHRAEDGRFTAEFPTAPHRPGDRRLRDRGGRRERDRRVHRLPRRHRGTQRAGGAVEGSAANVKGTIQSKTDTTFVGQPAKDIVVTTYEATVNERIFLVDNRLYTLIGVARSGRSASYDRLLETFALL